MILGMGAVAAIAMAATAYLGGLRFNLTPSYTLGIWRIVPLDQEVVVGDLIFICPPRSDDFVVARERGYLRPGLCPEWLSPLIKTVVAKEGQHVETGRTIIIDGSPLPHSEIRHSDADGRELPMTAARCRRAISFSTRTSQVPMTRDISGRSRKLAFLDWPDRSSRSRHDVAKTAILTIVAIVVSVIGWSGGPLLLPVAMLFPALWAMAPTRASVVLVSAAYFLAASRDLPQGVVNFYGSGMGAGLALWIAAAAGFVIVHAALWTARPGWGRAMRYAVAALLMSVPPFGIVGWAHPITAAGVLFPGWGWFGLAATAVGLLVATTRYWPIATLVMGGAFAWSVVNWTPPSAPEGWVGIDTSFQFSEAGQYADYAQHIATIGMVKQAAGHGASTIVLPSSMAAPSSSTEKATTTSWSR